MFLYANKWANWKRNKKTIPFTISTKRRKYLGINLSKEAKDLYIENSKTLMNGIEDNAQKNGKIFCADELEELTLLKCPYYLKQSIDSMQSLSNSQWYLSQK